MIHLRVAVGLDKTKDLTGCGQSMTGVLLSTWDPDQVTCARCRASRAFARRKEELVASPRPLHRSKGTQLYADESEP